MTTEEAIQAKLDEGIEHLNRILIRRVSELWTAAGDLAERPRIAAILNEEHARMLQWHAEIVAQLEAALLRASNKLN